MEKGAALTREKIIFCPQNDKSGCILTQLLTGKNSHYKACNTDFTVHLRKQQCKNYL